MTDDQRKGVWIRHAARERARRERPALDPTALAVNAIVSLPVGALAAWLIGYPLGLSGLAALVLVVAGWIGAFLYITHKENHSQ